MVNIGQLFISGIEGLTLTDFETEIILREKIGGIILFTRNYDNPEQLGILVNSIQKLRDEFPLFISVDHEGGRVIRFKKDFTQFPSMLNVAKNKSPKICFEIHQIMAKELSACGINLSFSPVCDLLINEENSVIGDRAFGSDPALASKYISAAVRGLEVNKVYACAKHFPGHGITEKGELGDSHFNLPKVSTSYEQLLKRELLPFQRAVKAKVSFIMMGHLLVETIDPELPCTFSEKAYAMLREELRYKNLIISDDMEMKAITNYCSVEEAAIKTLKAGCDILLYRKMEDCERAIKACKDALKHKQLSKQAIEDKINRTIKTKIRFLNEYKPLYIPSLKQQLKIQTTKVFMQRHFPGA